MKAAVAGVGLLGLMAVCRAGDAPVAGRFVDAHAHFNDTKPGDLDAVIAWMDAHDVQRIVKYPLAQTRAKNDAQCRAVVLAGRTEEVMSGRN